MATPVSLRLPEETATKVRRLAALEQRSYADMVKILTDEAVKMREFPEIYFADGPTGRRARFHQGPDVWKVLEPYLLNGKSWDILRQSFDFLPEELLRAAVRYYEQYPAEIEARITLNRAA
jgi:hypothetical protein